MARRPYGGRPGDGAKSGFLGGAHSVRPPSMAKRVPRDSVFTRWPGGAGSPTGTCPDGAKAVLEGVRSPFLQERRSKARWPRGGRPGDDAKGGFSEGRTLCVRVVRPRECQDIAFPPGAFTIAPQPKRGMLGLARCFPLRACGARPSAGGQAQDRSPSGQSPQMTRKAVFSEGRTLCVPEYGPDASQSMTQSSGANERVVA
jgi:hypothetical protein